MFKDSSVTFSHRTALGILVQLVMDHDLSLAFQNCLQPYSPLAKKSGLYLFWTISFAAIYVLHWTVLKHQLVA